jgi:hypothetical protein
MKTIKLIDQLRKSAVIYDAEMKRYDDLSDAELRELIGCMSDASIACVIGCMSGASIARVIGCMPGASIGLLNLEIPIVENLDHLVCQAVGAGGENLDMGQWHCGMTHCRGGWAIHLAGEAGYALQKALGDNAGLAAKCIYEASTGRPAPNFFASNKDALADIKARAMEGVK